MARFCLRRGVKGLASCFFVGLLLLCSRCLIVLQRLLASVAPAQVSADDQEAGELLKENVFLRLVPVSHQTCGSFTPSDR